MSILAIILGMIWLYLHKRQSPRLKTRLERHAVLAPLGLIPLIPSSKKIDLKRWEKSNPPVVNGGRTTPKPGQRESSSRLPLKTFSFPMFPIRFLSHYDIGYVEKVEKWYLNKIHKWVSYFIEISLPPGKSSSSHNSLRTLFPTSIFIFHDLGVHLIQPD